MKKSLHTVYNEVMDSLNFEESLLNYSLLERHIEQLKAITQYTNSLISVYDNFKRRHAFLSANHEKLFKHSELGDLCIHPEDHEQVMLNAIACMRHFFIGNKNAANHKLIREYRIEASEGGAYKRVIEQIQPLEFDVLGNIWLVISVLDFSPNQSLPFHVNAKIVNFKTGDFITPIDSFYDKKSILTKQEIIILKKINEGLLSKEIASQLCISIHTVNTHRQKILQKLEVNNSIEAIRYASTLGLLEN